MHNQYMVYTVLSLHFDSDFLTHCRAVSSLYRLNNNTHHNAECNFGNYRAHERIIKMRINGFLTITNTFDLTLQKKA